LILYEQDAILGHASSGTLKWSIKLVHAPPAFPTMKMQTQRLSSQ